MNKIFLTFISFLMVALNLCAQKKEVTIDGSTYPSQRTLYLIINEDTAHAQLLPIQDGKFSVAVKVSKNDFIRLHDYKGWPERCPFVLIPDSRHITVNFNYGTIEGSPMSKRLHDAILEVSKEGPDNFHVDVFSDNKEAWAEAREFEKSVRMKMTEQQKEVIRRIIDENPKNLIPAWLTYCYSDLFFGGIKELTHRKKGKWTKHPILKLKIDN